MFFMWRSALCVLMSVTMLCASAPLAMAGNEFGALYIGNYDDYDADVFRSRMLATGWTQEVWKTSNSSIRSMKPAHFHLTDGIDGRLTEAGDDCDLLYISGHGWRRAKFPIYWNKGASSPYDSISADSNNVGGSAVHPWEVGVDWSGKYPSNQSRWDYDIEWAIFAACSQLDYRTSSDRLAYSNSWPRNSAAKTWARTLLGEPNRMHAILGYWDTAPAGTTDVAVIREFLYQAIDKDLTVGDAWARANAKYGLPWAFVTHVENRADRLHGQGAGATADTKATSAYHIDYYRSGVSARMLDGRGGSYEQLSKADQGVFERLASWTRGLLGAASANAGGGIRARSRDGRVELRGRAVTPREVAGAVEVRPATPTPARLRRAFGGSSDASASALVSDCGSFRYHSGRDVGHKPVVRPMQHAVALARSAVNGLGEEFEGAQVAEVRAVTRARMDLESEEPDDEEVVQYSVRLVQDIGGVFLDGPGVGIEVTVDGLGVSDVTGYWVDENSSEAGATRNPMAAETALSRRSSPQSSLKIGDPRVVARRADVVYHIDPETDEVARPAWRYELDEGVALYADAVNGRAVD